jgi:hypothetical protein
LSPFTLKVNAEPFISPTGAPQDKIIELTNRLKICLDAKKVSLRELQSLLGLLNFGCQAKQKIIQIMQNIWITGTNFCEPMKSG